MAMNNEAAPKEGGSGGGELEKRVTGVESRLGVIEKTMVTAEVFKRELGALRDEMRVAIGKLGDAIHVGFGEVRKEMQAQDGASRVEIGGLRDEIAKVRVEIATIPFENFKWLLAAGGLAAAIATAIYNIWFR